MILQSFFEKKSSRKLIVFALIVTLSLGIVSAQEGGIVSTLTGMFTTQSFIGGGTAQNPYQVSSCDDLTQIADDKDAYYELVNDINCGTLTNGIDEFQGVLDGNRYSIKNLQIDSPGEERVGLFQQTNGKVKNLRIEDAEISGSSKIGIIAGYAGGMEVSNVRIEGSTVGSLEGNASDYVGGIIGNSGSGNTITDTVIVNTTIKGSKRVGGVAGELQHSEITKVYSEGDIEIGGLGPSKIGGLVGRIDGGSIKKSASLMSISNNNLTLTEVGGVAGKSTKAVSEFIDTYSASYIPKGGQPSSLNQGGFIGKSVVDYNYYDPNDHDKFTDTYWDENASNISKSDGESEALNTSEMTGFTADQYLDDLNWDQTWRTTKKGYPIHQLDVSFNRPVDNEIGVGRTPDDGLAFDINIEEWPYDRNYNYNFTLQTEKGEFIDKKENVGLGSKDFKWENVSDGKEYKAYLTANYNNSNFALVRSINFTTIFDRDYLVTKDDEITSSLTDVSGSVFVWKNQDTSIDKAFMEITSPSGKVENYSLSRTYEDKGSTEWSGSVNLDTLFTELEPAKYTVRMRVKGTDKDGNILRENETFVKKIKPEFSGGKGTEADPYEIENCNQLQNMEKSPSSHYELMNDIDCSNTVNWNNGNGFNPIGDSNNDFEGSLYGRGKTIENLYLDRHGSNKGFIENLRGGSITNITFEDADLNFGNSKYTGLVGRIINGEISNLRLYGDIETDSGGDRYTGGVAGRMDGSSVIKKSYVNMEINLGSGARHHHGLITGRINGDSEVKLSGADGVIRGGNQQIGGCVGHVNDNGGATLKNSFCWADVVPEEGCSANQGCGGVAGELEGNVQNVYAANIVSRRRNTGGFACDQGGSSTSSYWDYESNEGYGRGESDACEIPPSSIQGVDSLDSSKMTGEEAKQFMNFDWNSKWSTTANYPVPTAIEDYVSVIEDVDPDTHSIDIKRGSEDDVGLSAKLRSDMLTEYGVLEAEIRSRGKDGELLNSSELEPGQRINASWKDLEDGRTYNWYLRINDSDTGEVLFSEKYEFRTVYNRSDFLMEKEELSIDITELSLSAYVWRNQNSKVDNVWVEIEKPSKESFKVELDPDKDGNISKQWSKQINLQERIGKFDPRDYEAHFYANGSNKQDEIIVQDEIENITFKTGFSGGNGSENNPYLIETCRQLQKIRERKSANYKLIDSVNCGENSFEKIEYFKGTLDGENYEISDIKVKSGLFGTIRGGAKVENIRIDGMQVSPVVDEQIGSLAQEIRGKIKNVRIKNAQLKSKNSVRTGGITATLKGGEIKETFFIGSIQGCKNDCGGLTATIKSNGLIKNSASKGSIRTRSNIDYIGGLIGNLKSGSVKKTFSKTDIQINSCDKGCGGHTGAVQNNGIINQSYTANTITNLSNSDPFATDQGGNVQNAYWDYRQNEEFTFLDVEDYIPEFEGVTALQTSEMQGSKNADTEQERIPDKMEGFDFIKPTKVIDSSYDREDRRKNLTWIARTSKYPITKKMVKVSEKTSFIEDKFPKNRDIDVDRNNGKINISFNLNSDIYPDDSFYVYLYEGDKVKEDRRISLKSDVNNSQELEFQFPESKANPSEEYTFTYRVSIDRLENRAGLFNMRNDTLNFRTSFEGENLTTKNHRTEFDNPKLETSMFVWNNKNTTLREAWIEVEDPLGDTQRFEMHNTSRLNNSQKFRRELDTVEEFGNIHGKYTVSYYVKAVDNNDNIIKQARVRNDTFKITEGAPDPVLGENNKYTFTNCNAEGREGPNQRMCNKTYIDTKLEDKVDVIGNGIQTWNVPYTGRYRIKAYGASGGDKQSGSGKGRGAVISSRFRLEKGNEMRILAGQEGEYTGHNTGYSGGGGTFVTINDDKSRETGDKMFDDKLVRPLIVAGGGGANEHGHISKRRARGQTATWGADGSSRSGGQNGGAGGSRNGVASGGSGFIGSSSEGGSESFLEGGLGASGEADGGFGGGGYGTDDNGNCDFYDNDYYGSGGGGGYSGGGAGHRKDDCGANSNHGGGGGGSFISSDAVIAGTSDGNWQYTGKEPHQVYEGQIIDLNEWNIGDGKVEITSIGSNWGASPAFNQTDVSTSPNLKVSFELGQKLNDKVNVSFINADTGAEIGSVGEVSEREAVETEWSGLNKTEQYSWYVKILNRSTGDLIKKSPTFRFETVYDTGEFNIDDVEVEPVGFNEEFPVDPITDSLKVKSFIYRTDKASVDKAWVVINGSKSSQYEEKIESQKYYLKKDQELDNDSDTWSSKLENVNLSRNEDMQIWFFANGTREDGTVIRENVSKPLFTATVEGMELFRNFDPRDPYNPEKTFDYIIDGVTFPNPRTTELVSSVARIKDYSQSSIETVEPKNEYTHTLTTPRDGGSHNILLNATDSDNIRQDAVDSFVSFIDLTVREPTGSFDSNINPNESIYFESFIFENIDNPIDKAWLEINHTSNDTFYKVNLENQSARSKRGLWKKNLSASQFFKKELGEYKVEYYANSTLDDGSTVTQVKPAPSTTFSIKNITISSEPDREEYNPEEEIQINGEAILRPDNDGVAGRNIYGEFEDSDVLGTRIEAATTENNGDYSIRFEAPYRAGTYDTRIDVENGNGIDGFTYDKFKVKIHLTDASATFEDNSLSENNIDGSGNVNLEVLDKYGPKDTEIDEVWADITSPGGEERRIYLSTDSGNNTRGYWNKTINLQNEFGEKEYGEYQVEYRGNTSSRIGSNIATAKFSIQNVSINAAEKIKQRRGLSNSVTGNISSEFGEIPRDRVETYINGEKYPKGKNFKLQDITLDRESVTLTNCGSNSVSGPSQNQCNSEYEGTALESRIEVEEGIQKIDLQGLQNITVKGAEGGNGDHTPGEGAIIKGEIRFNEKRKLSAIVGQKGDHYSEAGGGGGGSFVWYEDSRFPLLAAGGGGGAGENNDGRRASTSTSGTKDRDNRNKGGINGLGGESGGGGGGGAGWLADGSGGNGGQAIIEGAEGGGRANFGGGARVGGDGGGGGGGYSGGAGSDNEYYGEQGGGGGGSFIHSEIQKAYASNGKFNTTGNEIHSTYSGKIGDLNGWNSGDGRITVQTGRRKSFSRFEADKPSIWTEISVDAEVNSELFIEVSVNPKGRGRSEDVISVKGGNHSYNLNLPISDNAAVDVWGNGRVDNLKLRSVPVSKITKKTTEEQFELDSGNYTRSKTIGTLTSCGSTGRFGPSQSDCDSTYSGELSKVNINDGLQTLDVEGGVYEFKAGGASGGHAKLGDGRGGKGFIINGETFIDPRNSIKAIIGQEGGGGSGLGNGAGGGGATFLSVTNGSDNLFDGYNIKPLIVAGGGGAVNQITPPLKSFGSNSTSGNRGFSDANKRYISGGNNGQEGGDGQNDIGRGGAGYFSQEPGASSQSLLNGAVGGAPVVGGPTGGFGGGAASYRDCREGQTGLDGGGGYSGGAGVRSTCSEGDSYAGGGGSFIAEEIENASTSDGYFEHNSNNHAGYDGNISDIGSFNRGNGYIRITQKNFYESPIFRNKRTKAKWYKIKLNISLDGPATLRFISGDLENGDIKSEDIFSLENGSNEFILNHDRAKQAKFEISNLPSLESLKSVQIDSIQGYTSDDGQFEYSFDTQSAFNNEVGNYTVTSKIESSLGEERLNYLKANDSTKLMIYDKNVLIEGITESNTGDSDVDIDKNRVFKQNSKSKGLITVDNILIPNQNNPTPFYNLTYGFDVPQGWSAPNKTFDKVKTNETPQIADAQIGIGPSAELGPQTFSLYSEAESGIEAEEIDVLEVWTRTDAEFLDVPQNISQFKENHTFKVNVTEEVNNKPIPDHTLRMSAGGAETRLVDTNQSGIATYTVDVSNLFVGNRIFVEANPLDENQDYVKAQESTPTKFFRVLGKMEVAQFFLNTEDNRTLYRNSVNGENTTALMNIQIQDANETAEENVSVNASVLSNKFNLPETNFAGGTAVEIGPYPDEEPGLYNVTITAAKEDFIKLQENETIELRGILDIQLNQSKNEYVSGKNYGLDSIVLDAKNDSKRGNVSWLVNESVVSKNKDTAWTPELPYGNYTLNATTNRTYFDDDSDSKNITVFNGAELTKFTPQNNTISPGTQIELKARVNDSVSGEPLENFTVTFKSNESIIDKVNTSSSGLATTNWTVKSGTNEISAGISAKRNSTYRPAVEELDSYIVGDDAIILESVNIERDKIIERPDGANNSASIQVEIGKSTDQIENIPANDEEIILNVGDGHQIRRNTDSNGQLDIEYNPYEESGNIDHGDLNLELKTDNPNRTDIRYVRNVTVLKGLDISISTDEDFIQRGQKFDLNAEVTSAGEPVDVPLNWSYGEQVLFENGDKTETWNVSIGEDRRKRSLSASSNLDEYEYSEDNLEIPIYGAVSVNMTTKGETYTYDESPTIECKVTDQTGNVVEDYPVTLFFRGSGQQTKSTGINGKVGLNWEIPSETGSLPVECLITTQSELEYSVKDFESSFSEREFDIKDDIPPEIEQLETIPNTPNIESEALIRFNVSDEVALKDPGFTVEVTDPSGENTETISTENITKIADISGKDGGRYEAEYRTKELRGSYEVSIEAQDKSNNRQEFLGYFDVQPRGFLELYPNRSEFENVRLSESESTSTTAYFEANESASNIDIKAEHPSDDIEINPPTANCAPSLEKGENCTLEFTTEALSGTPPGEYYGVFTAEWTSDETGETSSVTELQRIEVKENPEIEVTKNGIARPSVGHGEISDPTDYIYDIKSIGNAEVEDVNAQFIEDNLPEDWLYAFENRLIGSLNPGEETSTSLQFEIPDGTKPGLFESKLQFEGDNINESNRTVRLNIPNDVSLDLNPVNQTTGGVIGTTNTVSTIELINDGNVDVTANIETIDQYEGENFNGSGFYNAKYKGEIISEIELDAQNSKTIDISGNTPTDDRFKWGGIFSADPVELIDSDEIVGRVLVDGIRFDSNILTDEDVIRLENRSNFSIVSEPTIEGQPALNNIEIEGKLEMTSNTSKEYKLNQFVRSDQGSYNTTFVIPEGLPDARDYDVIIETRETNRSVSLTNRLDRKIRLPDTTDPEITFADAENVEPSSSSELTVRATDNNLRGKLDGVQKVKAEIEGPEGNITNVSLTSTGSEWSTNFRPDRTGDYNVKFKAFDPDGNTETQTTILRSANTTIISGDLQNFRSEEQELNLTFRHPETGEEFEDLTIEGNYSKNVYKGEYDIVADYGDDRIILESSTITDNSTDIIKVQRPNPSERFTPPADPVIKVIGFKVNTNPEEAQLNLSLSKYEDEISGIDPEEKLRLSRCQDYNFESNDPKCDTDEEFKVFKPSDYDVYSNSVIFNTSGFSSYALYIPGKDTINVTDPNDGEEEQDQEEDTGSGGGGGGGGGFTEPIADELDDNNGRNISRELNFGSDSLDVNLVPGGNQIKSISLENGKNQSQTVSIDVESSIEQFTNVPESFEVDRRSTEELIVEFSAPLEDNPSTYTGTITLETVNKSKQIPVNIRILPPEQELLDLTVDPVFSNIRPGENVRAEVDISNEGFARNVDVTLDVQLVDPSTNEVINSDTRTLAVGTTTTEVIELETSENIEMKQYELSAQANYTNLNVERTASAVSPINVGIPFWERTILGLSYVKILQIMAVLLLTGTAGFVGYNHYKERIMKKKRYLEDLDLSTIPSGGKRQAFIGELAEMGKRTFIKIDDLKTHALIAGATGSGKTVTGQVIVEEALNEGVNVVVLDPTAQWSGFLRENDDQAMQQLYKDFNMSLDDRQAFDGNIRAVEPNKGDKKVSVTGKNVEPEEKIDITPYLQNDEEGNIIVFSMHKLDNENMDAFVDSTIQQVFDANLGERDELNTLIVYDEAHRLLKKFGGSGKGLKQLERGAREFRKWGVGMILLSQVVSDFPGEVRANVGTTVQMRTQYEDDLHRAKDKFGMDTVKSIAKAEVGSGMLNNSEYNHGRPYFVNFRPLLHSPHRLSDEELEKYEKFNRRISKLEAKIEEMDEEEAFDYKSELKLAKRNLKKGSFNLVDVYLSEMEEDLE